MQTKHVNIFLTDEEFEKFKQLHEEFKAQHNVKICFGPFLTSLLKSKIETK